MRPALIWALTLVVMAGGIGLAQSGAARPVRIVFVGDVMLDNGPGHVIAHGGDPFADVAGVLRDTDLAVANLECAIVTEGRKVDKNYTFRGREAALPVLKMYFSAVSLANNHSSDWGRRGLLSELVLLRQAHLEYFGAGANLSEARRPLVLEASGRRIALLGYNGFNMRFYAAGRSRPGVAPLIEKEMVADIRAARTREMADFVIPFLHWGEELEPKPEKEQEEMARHLIDAGADAVIGGHPHVTQTVDWYRGKPIIYSIGNFVFDYWPSDPLVWTGWIVRLTLGSDLKLETIPVELDAAGVPHLKRATQVTPAPTYR
jgi:poly-gamma-glutamate capsule biosynthesis protein CapA/YwtB (metallophosphatase superfamily)